MKQLIKNVISLLILTQIFTFCTNKATDKVQIPDEYSKCVQSRVYEPIIIEGVVTKGLMIQGKYSPISYCYSDNSYPIDLYYDKLNRVIMGIVYDVNSTNTLIERFRFKFEYMGQTSYRTKVTFNKEDIVSIVDMNRKPNGKYIEVKCNNENNIIKFPNLDVNGNIENPNLAHSSFKYIYDDKDNVIESITGTISTKSTYSTNENGDTIMNYFTTDNSNDYYYENIKGLSSKGYHLNKKKSNETIMYSEYFVKSKDTPTQAVLDCIEETKSKFDNKENLLYSEHYVNSINSKTITIDTNKITYDKYGNVIEFKKEIYGVRGHLITSYNYSIKYKYNSKGDWVEKYFINESDTPGKVEYIQTRDIKYNN